MRLGVFAIAYKYNMCYNNNESLYKGSDKMKKVLALLMTFVIFAASFSFNVSAFAVQTSNILKTRLGTSDTYYSYDADKKVLTLSGKGAIPNLRNNSSSQPWFNWRSDGSIETVVIEEGITSVGDYSLYQVCASEISLPSTLRSIGNYSFAYNTQITKIEIPFGVQTIGASAFENCSSLESVAFPDTLVVMGKNSFKQCYALKSLEVPYSVQLIGTYAFYRCTSLSNISFESMSSPVAIGAYAFMSCPNLLNLSVPLNATLDMYSFGYNENHQKYDGIRMQVYSGSDGLTYAKTKSISYTILDSIPLYCGVENCNQYIEETMGYVYTYTFVPGSSISYNFYSKGSADVNAVLYDSRGKVAGENDDIDLHNFNFCITAQLNAGEEYTLVVNSVKSTGEYSVTVYPDTIESFDVAGSLSFHAADGTETENSRYFDITEDMLSDFVLYIKFEGGYEDKIYFKSGHFDNKIIAFADNQSVRPFTCGENFAQILIGNLSSNYMVNIIHSYEQRIVEPTVDDDGYTLFTCVLCQNSYKDNFIQTTAVTVSGRAVLMEQRNGSHDHNIPYNHATFYANNRTYSIDENGYWSVNTFDDLDLTFKNEFGRDVTVHIDVGTEDVDCGTIAFIGYDFNGDGRVNAKDFAIFLKQKQSLLGEDYWDYAVNFI